MASDKVYISKLKTLTGTVQTIHSVSPERNFVSTRILLTNTNIAAVTVRLCYVPIGGTAAQGNAALWDYSMPANTFLELKAGQILNRLGTIQGLAGTASVVNVFVSGEEVN